MHGALQTGALTTTFTASQGLLLMMPNLYKIAGELTPAVVHVASRTVATHALSIFGDHSDTMAMRMTGMAILSSNSVQEAMDMALIAHAATLETRIPFLHFFDGFRTSHEVQKIDQIPVEVMQQLINDDNRDRYRGWIQRPLPTVRGRGDSPSLGCTVAR
jgi:pyruvate-ferredoxin/flavodoxin oxidoreductase